MAPLRSTSIPPVSTLFHVLLCFVVLMQMLGAPLSLWQPDVPSDLVKASLLEGFSLIPSRCTVPPTIALYRSLERFMTRPSVLLGDSPFRPPLPYHPPMSLA
ncbi:hypothetical protein [Nitrospira moscoviensis]|uniref:Uncharacterized protein n=1 Tax=Nitrospira moscoviensis TaxID=42253 RepID=A0A0K2GD93_NITMO|nr:hypothetical protein [Nitrospira moscoviensis]ALA58844.1 hypothetical protein NITMOv2_2431 [Nitrospira moscoviensis]